MEVTSHFECINIMRKFSKRQAPTGVNAKDSPLCNLPRNVFLSTGKPFTQEYTFLRKGMLKIAEVMRQLPSSPIFPGRRRSVGLKANTAYGSYGEEV